MTFIKRYPYFTIWILFIVIILVIILLFIVYNKINKLEKIETFENDPSETISVSIGNEICRYFYYMGLAILEQKDFTYDRIFDETYKNYKFFIGLPTFLPFETTKPIYLEFVKHGITYETMQDALPKSDNYIKELSAWFVDNNILHTFWKCMKPLVHSILNNAFIQSDLVQVVDNPVIHFRCADTPFIKLLHYFFQKYDFFSKALNEIKQKIGIKNNKVIILYYNKHLSSDANQTACNTYADELKKYLQSSGYTVEIQSKKDIEDFATLFYAPAAISTSSSFSFMSGFFGNGLYISPEQRYDTEPDSLKSCDQCEWQYRGYNVKHDTVNDYTNTEEVLVLLK